MKIEIDEIRVRDSETGQSGILRGPFHVEPALACSTGIVVHLSEQECYTAIRGPEGGG